MSAPGIDLRVARCDGCGLVCATWRRPSDKSNGIRRRLCVDCIGKPQPYRALIRARREHPGARGYRAGANAYRQDADGQAALDTYVQKNAAWWNTLEPLDRLFVCLGFGAGFVDAEASERASA